MGRHTIVLLGLTLSAASPAGPAVASAQPTRAGLIDSALRLDSLAAALKVYDRPTPETRERAVKLWAQAAALYQRAGDRRRQGDMLTQAGRGHSNRDTAAVYLQTALEIAREVGDTAGRGKALLWLGVMQIRVAQYDSALNLTRQAAQIARQVGDRWGESRAWAFYWVGWPYLRLGQLDSAETYYREAVRVARATGARTPEAGSLGDIGNLHGGRGRFDSALVYYYAALQGFRAVGHRPFEASWLNNIGNVHNGLGRPDSALIYYRRSLEIARETGHRGLEQVLTMNIGIILMGWARVDSAAVYFRNAATLARKLGDKEAEAVAIGNLAEAQHALGQTDSAFANLRASIATLRAVGSPGQESGLLTGLGKIHAAAGRPDSALAAYGEGLRVARGAGFRDGESNLLQGLGDLHARGLARPNLASAVAYYDSAASIRAAMAASAGADQSRVSYAETGSELFDHWTLAWLGRAAELGAEPSALAALAVAERGRAQALLDLLRRGQTNDSTTSSASAPVRPVGADLVREGRELAAAVQMMGVPVLAYMSTKDTLLTWVILPTGEVTVERRGIPRDSVAQLVASIRRQVGADESLGRALRSIESTAEPAASGSGPGRAATRASPPPSAERFEASASALIPATLAARLPPGGELLVVPHGPLGLVAFAALPVRSGSSRGTSTEPLGARYAIRYAPSLTTLRAVAARAARRSAVDTALHGALVVGNPSMPRVTSARGGTVRLPSLPGAAREGEWVAKALGVAPLTGRAATERTVRNLFPNAPVIHLATHGFAYSADSKVLDSFVAFAPDSAGGRSGDGLLTVGEVIDEGPRLTAELVVLSACQTGLGNLRQAEGTVGLQRAFLAKGARSVLVSLWSVSDEATELLMRRFYTHWLRDPDRPSKAEALRRAQADVRRTRGFSSPRFWAAFQLVGAQ